MLELTAPTFKSDGKANGGCFVGALNSKGTSDDRGLFLVLRFHSILKIPNGQMANGGTQSLIFNRTRNSATDRLMSDAPDFGSSHTKTRADVNPHK